MENVAPQGSFRRGPAIWVRQFGKVAEAAELGEAESAPPAAGGALVQMEYAPINPADLNVLEGKYGRLPSLPAVVGMEGAGRVLEVGADVDAGAWVGRRVLLPQGGGGAGTWRRYLNASVADMVIVPESVPAEQAAMLRINPATALRMLEGFVDLAPGDWVVQNAANSGVGRAVIQIAKACGWKTINVVRRAGLETELKSIGADVVLEEGEGLAKRIAAAAEGAPLRLGLNAVGGECALEMCKALATGGTLVTYGAMALQPLRIPNGLLIFKDLNIRGFWVSRWYAEASESEKSALFARLFAWACEGRLYTPVEAVYPLEAVADALANAMKGHRAGKVLFRCH